MFEFSLGLVSSIFSYLMCRGEGWGGGISTKVFVKGYAIVTYCNIFYNEYEVLELLKLTGIFIFENAL